MAGQNAAPSYRQKADRSPTIRRIRPCGAERLRCDPVLHFAAYALIATATKTAQSVIAGLLGQRTYRLKISRALKMRGVVALPYSSRSAVPLGAICFVIVSYSTHKEIP